VFAIVPSNLRPYRILRCTSERLKFELLCIVTSNMMQNYLTDRSCGWILMRFYIVENVLKIAEGERSPCLEGKSHSIEQNFPTLYRIPKVIFYSFTVEKVIAINMLTVSRW
jgi:hypothetical protein